VTPVGPKVIRRAAREPCFYALLTQLVSREDRDAFIGTYVEVFHPEHHPGDRRAHPKDQPCPCDLQHRQQDADMHIAHRTRHACRSGPTPRQSGSTCLTGIPRRLTADVSIRATTLASLIHSLGKVPGHSLSAATHRLRRSFFGEEPPGYDVLSNSDLQRTMRR
jgi:hypothetical protein